MADPQAPPGAADIGQTVLNDVSQSLLRRGYLTTEWWTTIIGGALSTILALIHVKASSATHVVAVVSPSLLAALYAITRTMHKSALASALGDVFPQAAQASSQQGPSLQQAPARSAPAATSVPPAATARTDPDFAFEGIPPIAGPDAQP
jgi:hypothetical protein